MIQQPAPTDELYPRVQHPSAPLLPALPVLDAEIVPSYEHTISTRRWEPAPWYRRPATAVSAAVTAVAIAATAAITMWATAPAPAPAPAPPVAVAAPAPPAPAPAPADTTSGALGGVAVLAVIAGICVVCSRGSSRGFEGTFSGRMR